MLASIVENLVEVSALSVMATFYCAESLGGVFQLRSIVRPAEVLPRPG
jgi:hypothetical protein